LKSPLSFPEKKENPEKTRKTLSPKKNLIEKSPVNNKPTERTLVKSNKNTPKDLEPKVKKVKKVFKVKRNLIKKNLT